MKRVFEIEVLVRLDCGAKHRSSRFFTDGLVVRKILEHLGLDREPPLPAPAGSLEESVFA